METFELLRSLLAEKVKDNAEITPRTNLRELGIDSVDLVEILLNFEEKMNLTFEDEAMLKLSTVQDVLDLSQEISNVSQHRQESLSQKCISSNSRS